MPPMIPHILAALALTASFAQADAPPQPVAELFPLADIRLLDGPFKDAQELDKDYLLRLDPDRFLSHMREAAGLQRKGEPYGGWERGASGMIGHYLSACSDMYAATGDPRLKERVDYIVDEMAACQDAGDACLYANKWEREHWFRLLQDGRLEAINVVPFYVMHKTLGGLRDAWKVAGSEKARDVLVRMTDRIDELTAKMTDAQWTEMTTKEFGAPAETIAEVYAFTGKPQHLRLAERFSKLDQLDALAKNDDSILAKKHANTIIPIFTGYQRIYEAGGGEKWHTSASNFWSKVIENQTFIFGGNSIWEAFIDPAEFNKKLMDICGPETCNTYNMLKLTLALYTFDPSVRFADYMERALYNQILTTQGPAPDGGFVYYTPTRPGHYRRYSKPFDAFWCCVGTGMENQGCYGQFIYASEPQRLLVNLFIPSELQWKAEGVTLRQTTRFPEQSSSTLTLGMEAPKEFTLSVRNPGWLRPGDLRISVNNTPVRVTAAPGEYANIERLWKNGDRIDVLAPPRLDAHFSPQGGKFVSFTYGPLVLAAPLGDKDLTKDDFYADGNEAFIQLGRKEITDVPAIKGSRRSLVDKLRRAPGNAIAFRTDGIGSPRDFELVPFSKIGLERYSVYFPYEEK